MKTLNLSVNLSIDEVKAALFQLPVEDLIILADEIEERLQTMQMMQLSETGFEEWNDDEENIYNVES